MDQPNAFAAESSSALAVAAESDEFFRKSWRIFHSPEPGVPPNAGGARSDMSKRKLSPASTIALPTAAEFSSGYTPESRFLLADVKLPVDTMPEAASADAR